MAPVDVTHPPPDQIITRLRDKTGNMETNHKPTSASILLQSYLLDYLKRESKHRYDPKKNYPVISLST